MNNTNKQRSPQLAVDMTIFTINNGKLKILLIQRKKDPFKDSWAIPGGMVEIDESLEAAARRELQEETGIEQVYLEQFGAFGDPDRDPRGRIVSIAYLALVPFYNSHPKAASDAKEVGWFEIRKLPELAFDHYEIITKAIKKIEERAQNSTIVASLLPQQFRLSDLHLVYETVLQKKLDKRNLLKKIKELDLLASTGEREVGNAHRPAMLYTFKSNEVCQI